MAQATQSYLANGVKVSKKSIEIGDEILVSYNGLLAEHGAEQVMAHYGYGDTWEEKSWLSMDWNNGAFTAKLKVIKSGNLNICFKDSIDNWDNNSSMNYTFKVDSKAKAKAVKETETTAKKVASKKTVEKSDVKSATKTMPKLVVKSAAEMTSKPTAKEPTKQTVKQTAKPATKETPNNNAASKLETVTKTALKGSSGMNSTNSEGIIQKNKQMQ